MLKRNWMRFAAVLLAAIANFVTVPNAALAAAPQHHDQVPGFYRLKVCDLEVTALFDGPGVFDVNWLNGEKTKDGVLKALHDDPHLLDVADAGYLVNTGKQLILVDAGSGTWFGGGKFGHLLASWVHARRSRPCFGNAPPLRPYRRPNHSGRKDRLSKCRHLCRKGRQRLLAIVGNRR
jgi:hypothetical protein